MEQRENLGSRLGFIMLSAGCAIGIGNVWRFPYMVGQNGGGLFVLIYLVFLVILGVPVMTMEYAMGRATRKSILPAYRELEPKGSKWHIMGYFAIAGNYVILMFYSIVSGWILRYFWLMVTGTFVGADKELITAEFGKMMGSPSILLLRSGTGTGTPSEKQETGSRSCRTTRGTTILSRDTFLMKPMKQQTGRI